MRRIYHPVLVAEKQCYRCMQPKPHSAFYRNSRSKDGLAKWCRDCEAEYRKANPPAPQAAGYYRQFRLKARYKMSQRGYQSIWDRQGGLCSICKAGPSDRLVIDHNHATGVVRGLLCHPCNAAIGYLEKKEWLAFARSYLLKAPGFRFCSECGDLVIGRADKRFCSRNCRLNHSIRSEAARKARWKRA